MRKFWKAVGACSIAASLAACGGGDDVSEDSAFANGSFTTCDAVDGGMLGSVRMTVAITDTRMQVTHRVYAGSRSCGGVEAAVVTFPAMQFTDAGTKLVEGPNGGELMARKAILTAPAGSVQATVYEDVDYSSDNEVLIIHDPNSTGDLYQVRLHQEAESSKEVLLRHNGVLYFGDDEVDAEQYPIRMDYSRGFTPL